MLFNKFKKNHSVEPYKYNKLINDMIIMTELKKFIQY